MAKFELSVIIDGEDLAAVAEVLGKYPSFTVIGVADQPEPEVKKASSIQVKRELRPKKPTKETRLGVYVLSQFPEVGSIRTQAYLAQKLEEQNYRRTSVSPIMSKLISEGIVERDGPSRWKRIV